MPGCGTHRTPSIFQANQMEARVGIEPTHKAFAEPCLTTWLPRHPAVRLRGEVKSVCRPSKFLVRVCRVTRCHCPGGAAAGAAVCCASQGSKFPSGVL